MTGRVAPTTARRAHGTRDAHDDPPGRAALRARIVALVRRGETGEVDAVARDALLADLHRWQVEHVPPFGRLARARGSPDARSMPALPTDVFRFARVAAHGPALDARVFRTSGTTSGRRGEHPIRDVELLALAVCASAKRCFFADDVRPRVLVVGPSETQAPDSSLAFMNARLAERFGEAGRPAVCWSADGPDVRALCVQLERAERDGVPVALLGTTLGLDVAERALPRRFRLHPASRVMQTGGSKGRRRAVRPMTLARRLAQRLGLGVDRVVSEYGMTELSSPLWEPNVREPRAPRRFEAPPWVRVSVVDPVRAEPLPEGRWGLVRLDDAANLDSCAAILTADVGRLIAGTLELRGRAPGAVARGCSLAVDERIEARRASFDA
ncbi:MAG: acyl-protein synthetase [Myxococcota bacterium]|nr:acyl-protein synthetase [Myxococcota bacterium]MDW8363318.1 hypothetical protein [Myxococcales bacterium]